MVKTKLYKIYRFDNSLGHHVGVRGLYHSIDEFLLFVKSRVSKDDFDLSRLPYLNYIKIPFFGYHSPQFTALDPRALAGTRRPRFKVEKSHGF